MNQIPLCMFAMVIVSKNVPYLFDALILSLFDASFSFIPSIIQVEGTIPSEIGLLTALTKLWLCCNSRLTGSIPTEIGRLTKLTEASLSASSFSSTIPPELGTLTQLTSLTLYDNNLVGTIPVQLTRLTNLERFEVYRNEVTGVVPTGFCDGSFTWDSFWADCWADSGAPEITCFCCTGCYRSNGASGNWEYCYDDFNNYLCV